MNEQWALGIKSAGVLVSIFATLCGFLALYIKLSMNSQLAAFLEKLTEMLSKTYVSKEVYEVSRRHAAETELLRAAGLEKESKHALETEALRLAVIEAKTEVRLGALEQLARHA